MLTTLTRAAPTVALAASGFALAAHLAAQELSPSEIAARVRPAVVSVTALAGGEKVPEGSGFIVSSDGRLVTNRHGSRAPKSSGFLPAPPCCPRPALPRLIPMESASSPRHRARQERPVETAEVVVVGGGIVGASVAWHLARRGCRDVVVLERSARPGEGSTGRATGGFRAQFGTAVNVRLSLMAREELLRFEHETGVDPGYDPSGYLFLAGGETVLSTLQRALAVQHDAGLKDSRAVGPDEIAGLNPHLRLEGILGGTFCPTDGFVRPLAMLRGYLEACARLGVQVRYREGCREILLERNGAGAAVPRARVTGVRTERGVIATPRVVDAAGAWASDVAALAGAKLPVHPERRQAAVTAPFDGLPDKMPMTIFADDGFHLRVRDGRVVLLWPRPARSDDPFDTRFDPAWLEGLMELAVDRVPCLAGAVIDPAACIAGLYEMSPDRHAILGESPEVGGFYFANGSSGHGVMHAPALGRILAEILLDGETSSLDARPLRPSRFAEDEPNRDIALL